MASESCPVCGEEADADVLDPHGHFTAGDDDLRLESESDDEEDDLQSLKQDENYSFTYSFEYIAKNYGDGKYDIHTADMFVQVDWSDAQAGYVISYDVPDIAKIDPEQGNSGAEGFYESSVYDRLMSDLESLDIGPQIIAT
ncbi:hypothetical protein [Rhodococcus sp. 1168]|uniref:hypothetical protein n=1 Tax=Rhodococcus sp. 1168 TaxID=2018041 RepID=UPI000A0D2510|nr:hypothetical protein [Rhodococcus sp. 1168]ORI14808.1 hypothetical protein BJI47_00910 [Rhodococcus sp. 1168]